MKFSTNLTLIFTTLLLTLWLNDAYGAPTNGPKDDDAKATSTGGLRSTATLVEEENENEELIELEASFVYTQQKDDKPLFTYVSYDINHDNRAKLGHAKSLVQLAFNDDELEFEDQSKLPNRDCWLAIVIFAGQDNEPIMLRIKVADDDKNFHYYYLLDEETKKFKNTAVGFVEEKAETDKEGLTRYHEPMFSSVRGLRETTWPELFESVAQGHDEAEEPLVDPIVELTIIPSDEQTGVELGQSGLPAAAQEDLDDKNTVRLTADYTYTREKDNEVLFTYTSYEVNQQNQDKIADSLFVPQISFNGVELEFEDGNKFPDYADWKSLALLTNRDNQAVTLRIKVTEEAIDYHYYYVFDAQTKKFKNTAVGFVEEKAETGKEGLTRHRVPLMLKAKPFFERIEQKWPETFKGLPQSRLQATEGLDKSVIELTLVPSGNPIKKVEAQPTQHTQANLVLVTVDGNSNQETVELEAYFDYTHQKDGKPLFTYSSYELGNGDRAKLGRSKEVPQLLFNGVELNFEDSTKLPNHADWKSLVLLENNDNEPVIVRFKLSDNGKNYHYYYVFDAQTKKFKNTAVGFVEEEEEKDEDGLVRYTEPVLVKIQAFCQKIEQKWS